MSVQTISPNLAAGSACKEFSDCCLMCCPRTGELAGLKVQDIILALNDKPVDSLPPPALIFPRTPEVSKCKSDTPRLSGIVIGCSHRGTSTPVGSPADLQTLQ